MALLDDILKMWGEDAQIDKSELGIEAAEITPKLHHKYLTLYENEKLKLYFLNTQKKKLLLTKHEFYIQGPSKEDLEKGWKLPPRGKVLRQDVQLYLDADKELSELQLKIDYKKEVIDTLDKIISQINGRSYLIGHALSDMKWKGGS